jgi:hypothetical protein
MYLEEILQLESEIEDDLKNVGDKLFRFQPSRTVAGNCLLVSVNMAELIQLAIQVEFDQYADTEIFLDIGSLGKMAADGAITWLWDDKEILKLSRDLIALADSQNQGYHAWLTFAGTVIDPTVLFTLTLGEQDSRQATPLYIDQTGATHPSGRQLRYRSLRRFSVADLQQYSSLLLH